METILIIFVAVLFLLAITDLVVGVSNDAVNFLVSAIGSRSAPLWVIMIIASLGIVFGTTFSSGMMEVARKGIMHPEMFTFMEIMTIFLAVMLTDIILLDVFNTFGMPTSTTVSIVFELLGAAVAISLLKLADSPDGAAELIDYINTGKALAIITGILLSVIIAFSVGAVVQYFARLLFSFNYTKSYKYFGALWGGIAVATITYFILIKGAKGSSFLSKENVVWIKEHTWEILFYSFLGWTAFMQLIKMIFKINILKIVVLFGTFALAMAFAGNDLVNFIGVPLAGLTAFKANADSLSMEVLTQKVQTPTLYLLIAGLIMVVTLWFSKKSRTVTRTSLNLSRQDEGVERFGSSLFSRSLVRSFISFGNGAKAIFPKSLISAMERRFEKVSAPEPINGEDTQAFDLVRASVNLVVASILIAIGTSLKLPLSTTYVTFMVAMGTSLADGAWGRESAVYRVTGVISVIGGWFLTAFVAFSVAFIFANIMHLGGPAAVFGILALAIFLLVRSRFVHKKREVKETESKDDTIALKLNVFDRCIYSVNETLKTVQSVYQKNIVGLYKENRKKLKEAVKEAKKVNHDSKLLKDNIHNTVRELQENSIETGHYYVQVVDNLREIAHCLRFIAEPSFKHIDNNHKGLTAAQTEEARRINIVMSNLFKEILRTIENGAYADMENVVEIQTEMLALIGEIKKNQLRRIKHGETSTRGSLLFLNMLAETKSLVLHVINLLKSQRDFVIFRIK